MRRQPLGTDRYNRCFWWGLGGSKDALLLQEELGAAEATLELLTAAARNAAATAAAGPSASDMMATAFAGAKPPGSAGKDTPAADGADNGQQQQQAGPDAVLQVPLNHEGLLLPRGPEGWARLEEPSVVEALMGACEVRGVREKELKANLDKVRE